MQQQDENNPRMLDKIRALLAKAESTAFAEEAEALAEKAQYLMTKYSIDASVARASRNAHCAEKPARKELTIDSPYVDAKFLLFDAVARANDCQAVWSKFKSSATVFGYADDIECAELLYTSLLMQATSAMLASGSHVDYFGQSRTKSFRRSFLIAYAYRIGSRLQESRDVAVKEQTSNLSTSVSLVLASKAVAVTESLESHFPNLQRWSPNVSNAAGVRAGSRAANTAVLNNQAEVAS